MLADRTNWNGDVNRATAAGAASGSRGFASPVQPAGVVGPGHVVGPATGPVPAVIAHQQRTVGAFLGGVAGGVEELPVERSPTSSTYTCPGVGVRGSGSS